MWTMLFALSAGAEELAEPGVALTEPVTSGERTFTSDRPMYLLPTTTFDRLLEDGVKLPVCQEGLSEVKESAVLLERRMGVTLDEARSALTACSGQMLDLQEQLTKTRRQRDAAIGVASVLLVSGIAGIAIAL